MRDLHSSLKSRYLLRVFLDSPNDICASEAPESGLPDHKNKLGKLNFKLGKFLTILFVFLCTCLLLFCFLAALMTVWLNYSGMLATLALSRTNVASVGSVFNDTRKVKVLSLPETIKEKSTFSNQRSNSQRRAFARNVDFSFIVSGTERTFTFRVTLALIIISNTSWVEIFQHFAQNRQCTQADVQTLFQF